MAITSNNKKGQDDKKYKVINLKYEYEGYEGSATNVIIQVGTISSLIGVPP